MAKIIIVDKNDKPVGSKERGDVDSKNDICRISILWIINSKDQILLAQRKITKKHNPGKWGPAVGGTVEEGETHESNIYKEAEEEIGITGEKFQLGKKFFISSPNKRFCQSYLLQIEHPIEYFTIQKEEVEQIRWMDRNELLKEIENNPDDYTQMVHIIMEK